MRGQTKKQNPFHAALKPKDTLKQTVGCRLTNPNTCSKNSLPKVCAFVRSDEMCLAPPSSWAKQFLKLKAGIEKKNGKVHIGTASKSGSP